MTATGARPGVDLPTPSTQASQRLDFVLPGVWWRFPLGVPEAEMQETVRGYVRRLLGQADHLAAWRRSFASEVAAAVQAATEAGAHQLHLGVELAPGVPLPGSLLITWPLLPVKVLGPERLRLEVLEASLDDPALETLPHPRFGVLRKVARRSAAAVDAAESTESAPAEPGDDALDVRYWITLPDERQLVCFAFSSLLVQLEEELVAMFDAVILTLQ